MRVVPSLLTPPPPPPKSVMPVLYYGLVVVVTAAIVLVLYNLVIIRLCTDHNRRRSGQRTIRTREPTSSRSFDNLNIHLVSSFKYKKEQEMAQDQGGEHECPVCLSVFEEGEEVRQLPRCKHSFHAPCIDMWLYSHFDCPVCRAPVEPLALRPQMVTDRSENSREGLLDIAISV